MAANWMAANWMAANTVTAAIGSIALAVVAASVAVAAGRQPPVIGLKEINSARQPLTPIVHQRGAPPLTPQQAKEQLEARGFRDVTPPKRRGHVAIVAATAPRGERITLVIDLATGEITGARLQAVPDARASDNH